MSVLLPLRTPESNPDSRTADGVVEWRPPHIDWNPWTSCSAYQSSGPYSTLEPAARADMLSQNLREELLQRKTRDEVLQKVKRHCFLFFFFFNERDKLVNHNTKIGCVWLCSGLSSFDKTWLPSCGLLEFAFTSPHLSLSLHPTPFCCCTFWHIRRYFKLHIMAVERYHVLITIC